MAETVQASGDDPSSGQLTLRRESATHDNRMLGHRQEGNKPMYREQWNAISLLGVVEDSVTVSRLRHYPLRRSWRPESANLSA